MNPGCPGSLFEILYSVRDVLGDKEDHYGYSKKNLKEASRLPEHLAREVLDFIEYIEKKHGLQDREIQNLKEAQIPVMNHIWDNEEDGVWDER